MIAWLRDLWRRLAWVDCPVCHGHGGWMETFGPYPGSYEPVDCPVCDAGGLLPRKRVEQLELSSREYEAELEADAQAADEQDRIEQALAAEVEADAAEYEARQAEADAERE